MYRVGYPCWRLLAQIGVPLKLSVDVHHDKEAGLFIATSSDLKGLVCEAATIDDLLKEVNAATSELLDLELHGKQSPLRATDLRLRNI
ncbi:DUF1902 domain-containing protein [Massilia sp. W12]|uniref:DUF1902 domain-containing protein n=1 Tax=Massilia sp. W12 TaxID=3126507 RepID=UPI0030D10DAB